jgi:hypothetical protein
MSKNKSNILKLVILILIAIIVIIFSKKIINKYIEGFTDPPPTETTSGEPEGTTAGEPEGTTAGEPEGTTAGTPEGTTAGTPEGTPAGTPAGTPVATVGNFGMTKNNGRMGGLNISQNGGEGYNNYFTPNIFIKRKNNTGNTQRVEFGLGKELQPFLAGLNPNGMTQTTTDLIYDNTGYNLGSYGSDWSDLTNQDPFNTAERNARLSYQREEEQSGTCLECNETDSGLDYSGTVDNFSNTTDKNNNFTHSCKMKKFKPGYQLQPPTCWDVPQKRPPVCLSDKKCLPAAVFDSGLSLNALQFDTAVGSIMPGFTYIENPRS